MRSMLRNLPLVGGALVVSLAMIGCDAGTTTEVKPVTAAPAPETKGMEGPAPKDAMEGPAPKGGAMEGPAAKTETEAPKADPAPPAVEKPKEEPPK